MPARDARGRFTSGSGGGSTVTINNPITARLGRAAAVSSEAVEQVLQYHEASGQNDMRQSAPWTDRTGNARQGLFAKAPGDHSLVLYHTMPYGIFLEKRWDGKFRVIMPAVQRTGRKVMRTLRGFYKLTIK